MHFAFRQEENAQSRIPNERYLNRAASFDYYFITKTDKVISYRKRTYLKFQKLPKSWLCCICSLSNANVGKSRLYGDELLKDS